MKFKDRYILGTGYPWVTGAGTKDRPYIDVGLLKGMRIGSGFKRLKFPKSLWDPNLPKYRLVLERVE